jgi:hypothetical protein
VIAAQRESQQETNFKLQKELEDAKRDARNKLRAKEELTTLLLSQQNHNARLREELEDAKTNAADTCSLRAQEEATKLFHNEGSRRSADSADFPTEPQKIGGPGFDRPTRLEAPRIMER